MHYTTSAMVKPLSLYIGLRYTRAKQRNHFISFISLASMLGIALGVAVLITVLSVMNGFDDQIRTRFFALAPQITALTNQPLSSDWQQLAKRIDRLPEVVGIAPFASGQGIIVSAGQLSGIQLSGIDPQQEHRVSQLADKIKQGQIASLIPGQFNLIIGQTLAAKLALRIGDKVNVFTPEVTLTLAGAFPRFRRFTITGIFQTGNGFGFETSVAYMNWIDAMKLFPASAGTRGLHISVRDLYQVAKVSRQIEQRLPADFLVTNWTQQFGAFFQALAMEKNMLFIILLLIVAVAVFNLVSTLVMMVNAKQAEIAILRTIGAKPIMIMMTFIFQGLIIGLVGIILGVIGGILLAVNVTEITNAIQQFFNVQFISSSVYFIDYLPSKLLFSDIVKVVIAAFGLSLLATIYPALMAFRTQPAEALRYE